MKLYIKVSNDKYELPIAVEDSPTKLAQKLGLERSSVATMCSKQINGYHRVEAEPDMWPDADGGLWYYDDNGRVAYV
ncbi:MAG: hypothetical protein K6E91_10995 [Butyrivibrio sp.]|nr:hypothetical protein [Butyrivibrio sp.]